MRRTELVKTAMVATVIATSAMMAGCGKRAPEINTESVIEEVKEKKEQVDKALEDVNEASEKIAEKIDAIEVPAPEVADNEMGLTREQAENLSKENWAKVDEEIEKKIAENPEKYATMTLSEYTGENIDLYYENVYKPRLEAVLHGYYKLSEITDAHAPLDEIKDEPLQFVLSEEREKELVEEEETMKVIDDVLDGKYDDDPNSAFTQAEHEQAASSDYVTTPDPNNSPIIPPTHTGHTWEGNDGGNVGLFHPGD